LRPTTADCAVLYIQCLPARHAVTPGLVEEVTQALSGTFAAGKQDDVRIVLAEAVNNIVEHAYAGSDLGAVIVCVTVTTTRLWIDLTDWGHPFPAECGPLVLPDPQGLSEGGYGTFLIRSLTSQVIRTRHCRENRLALGFDL
jgi:serine/threonine-protein kinase RsbW